MKVLMINLDQSKDRLEQQKIQFLKLGLVFERLPAISIKDFTEDEYKKLAFSGQRPLKQSELACFLSHKKAWEYVVSLNEPCVVLEDDAVLVHDLKKILAQVEDLEDSLEFLNLEVHGRKKIVSKQPAFILADTSFKLFNLYQDRSGTGGYIIFPKGAKRLLEYMQARPIGLADEFIYSCRSLKAYQIEPAALLQSDKCLDYGIKTNIPYQSVIALVKNSLEFNLSASEKVHFKTRRIKRQLQLGYFNIVNIFQGKKRHIQVKTELF